MVQESNKPSNSSVIYMYVCSVFNEHLRQIRHSYNKGLPRKFRKKGTDVMSDSVRTTGSLLYRERPEAAEPETGVEGSNARDNQANLPDTGGKS
ncbi:hypothetical protein PoB_002750400 [Plakobranchus ocellatus]|uniref:DET1- and DDB1-associated protein 1 n=1 Tax=Plakobranchus ocellatus TaxID=259542 RepID=A0AAV4A2Z8_9GAST|nr:hypothetical protein PoB_002750400 [Plakobranchus ocellatus]